MQPSWDVIVTTAVITAAQAGITYVLFEVYRKKQGSKSIYEPKLESRPKYTPGAAKLSPFGWIGDANSVSDAELVKYAGLDTFIFVSVSDAELVKYAGLDAFTFVMRATVGDPARYAVNCIVNQSGTQLTHRAPRVRPWRPTARRRPPAPRGNATRTLAHLQRLCCASRAPALQRHDDDDPSPPCRTSTGALFAPACARASLRQCSAAISHTCRLACHASRAPVLSDMTTNAPSPPHAARRRFLRMTFFITAVSAAFAMAILFPVYAVGDNNSAATTGYNQYTIGNLKEKAATLWVPLVFWWIFVFFVLSMFRKEWHAYMPLRRKYLAEGDADTAMEYRWGTRVDCASLYLVDLQVYCVILLRRKYLAEGDADTAMEYRYTALVEGIPASKRSSAALFGYFAHVFPGQVSKATLCMDTQALEQTIGKRDQALVGIEKAEAFSIAKPDKPPMQTKVGGKACCGGKKVDAATHFKEELETLNTQADNEHRDVVALNAAITDRDLVPLRRTSSKNQADAASPEDIAVSKAWSKGASSSGFVTFTSLVTKSAATQCQVAVYPQIMETFSAPAPNDVLWHNVTMPIDDQRRKRAIANAFFTVGILFWAIPVMFTQTVANLEGLREKCPWLWIPDQGTALYGLLSGYLPVILLVVLMILVPIVIGLAASKFFKVKAQSQVDEYIFRWHFGFQVANLFLVIIGGSIFTQLSAAISDPSGIITLLASALPGASQYFMNLVIVAIGGLGMELSRVVPIIIAMLMGALKPEKALTQRELDARMTPPSFAWGIIYPPLIFSFMVGMTYVCLVPVIQPVVALYYGLAYVVFKHQVLHVYHQRSEGGGAYFPMLYSFLTYALACAEVVMIVYFGIAKAPAQAVLAVVPLVATLLFNRHVSTHYVPSTRMLALEIAREVDAYTEKNGGAGPVPASEFGAYTDVLESAEYAQPALRRSLWETQPRPYRDGGAHAQDVSRTYKSYGVEDAIVGGPAV
ncbi:hypothetical protein JKP88DRAFT_262665 [Tribonema minus]|uniref:DUF221-domain-containing protein n=1 Tax=Tribonema minus TaxID=303371 RepID=A0A835Z8B3_9STRA|nr:hypothetical protein JKP88DRAFT_262665 [Tribonema minus]